MTAPPKPLKASELRVRRLAVVAVLLVVVVGTFNTTFEYVAPYEVGIKESRYAGGLQQEPLAGGKWYLTGPGVTVYRFPTTLQAVEFAGSASEAADRFDAIFPAGQIEIDTSDGSKMKADVTVLYRIQDAYQVIKEFGPGRTFELNGVVPRAQAALKENLGHLLAEDFYSEEKREKETLNAMNTMKPLLEKSGLLVEHVLIRQYYYNRDYQKQIEARKVQDQLVFTQNSRAEASKEDARKRKIVAEGEAEVAVEKRRGEAELTKIQAEASLYSRRKHADGDLLVALARARGTELQNAAYEGGGSDNLVAERMAEVLRGMDTIVISERGGPGAFNPLDLDGLVKMFGAKGVGP
jgi:regulator of protease activity HflC (stomatin/prohibitin superfamily)